MTESLESVPRTWKVVEHVREKFSCRTCEAITQPPAPSHPIARGRAGPSLLALVLVSKYGHHLPLHRQSAIYAREGVEIDVSTLADWVGAVSATAMPLVLAIQRHVLAAERIHADDTTVPVLAKEKTKIGRLWAHVRDDRPFGGSDPPAAAFFYSPDRGGEHPERQLAGFSGIMQADAYAGFNRLYEANRQPGPILEAACWAHARRKFFELAAVAKAPIAAEAVRRIDQLFAIERDINGRSADERRRARQEQVGTARCRARALAARPAGRVSRQVRDRQGDRLHAQALDGIHPVPRRRPDLPTTDGVEKRECAQLIVFVWSRPVGRPFLPRLDHPLVSPLGALDIVHLPLADLLDPVVTTRAQPCRTREGRPPSAPPCAASSP